MKKLCCVICGKYKKFEKPKTSHILEKLRNCFIEEIKQNELTSRKDKNDCTNLSYIEHVLVLASAIIGYIVDICWYSYRNYEFCNGIKNSCNNC